MPEYKDPTTTLRPKKRLTCNQNDKEPDGTIRGILSVAQRYDDERCFVEPLSHLFWQLSFCQEALGRIVPRFFIS